MLFQNLLIAATTATVASAAAIQSTGAALQFMFPKGRPTVVGEIHKQPCGNSANGEVTQYPLSGGQISLAQGAASDNVNFLWSKYVPAGDENYEFKTYGAPTVVDLSSGHYCADGPDFGSLGFKAGDKATIMIMFQNDGPPGKGFNKRWNFQCADVELVDNWAKPEKLMCGNAGKEIRVADAGQIMNVTVSSESQPNAGQGRGGAAAAASSSSGITLPQAGGIGAGAAAALFLLVLGALWATGLLRIGRKQNVVLRDDASSVGSIVKPVQP